LQVENRFLQIKKTTLSNRKQLLHKLEIDSLKIKNHLVTFFLDKIKSATKGVLPFKIRFFSLKE